MKSYEELCAEKKSVISEVSPERLSAMTDSFVVDIREPDEIAAGMS